MMSSTETMNAPLAHAVTPSRQRTWKANLVTPADGAIYNDVFEHASVARYRDTIGGIPDCFDVLDMIPRDSTDLRYLGDLLERWWEAIDSLDSCYDETKSEDFRMCLNSQLRAWFTARQDLFLQLAVNSGVRIPQPDSVAGVLRTSNHIQRVYVFHPIP